MSEEKLNYSSATFTLLDRDTDEVKNFMAYPTTRVVLNDFHDPGLVTSRTFIVIDGKWSEVQ